MFIQVYEDAFCVITGFSGFSGWISEVFSRFWLLFGPNTYALPKIHKPDVPLRPIISAFRSPTHKLAQHLAKTLQPLAEQSNSYIKNSFHFLQRLKYFNISPNSLLVSFDVISLFTKISLSETFEILKNKYKIRPNTLSLFQYCTSNTYFSFQHCLFK